MGLNNNENKKIIGYLPGTFDLFHIGHLNIIKRAKQHCDFLMVGVNTDETCVKMKNKTPVIPLEERCQIVEAIKYVDKVVEQNTRDRYDIWLLHKFDRIFVGSDWKGTEKWNILEEKFHKVGVQVVYFDYTQTTSSTLIRTKL